MIWTLDDTDLRHAPGNWIEMTDLTYNNPELKVRNGTDNRFALKTIKETSW